MTGITAVADAHADFLERFLDAVSETSGKDARFGGRIVSIFARFGAEFDDSAVIDDNHALTVCNSDSASVRDDVFASLGIGRFGGNALLSLCHQHIRRQSLAVEEFLPLVSHSTADRAENCFQ